MSLREVCHCSHDRDTHHERTYACTGLHCECRQYVDENDPPPRSTLRAPAPDDYGIPRARPHADVTCGCVHCIRWKWGY